jgi:drug/metabolite transporter (DMT)-like permease
VGVCVGFIGVLVLVLGDLMASGLGGLKGQIAAMIARCNYAISTVIARRLSQFSSISTSAMLSASLYMIPLAFLLENPLPEEVSATSAVSLAFRDHMVRSIEVERNLFEGNWVKYTQ